MGKAATQDLDSLSPFELKDLFIKAAKESSRKNDAAMLRAGRGNPNWIATTPRESFFLLGQFGLDEARRIWSEPDLGGMPDPTGIADRFAWFLARAGDSPAVWLLRHAVDYGVCELGLDADEL